MAAPQLNPIPLGQSLRELEQIASAIDTHQKAMAELGVLTSQGDPAPLPPEIAPQPPMARLAWATKQLLAQRSNLAALSQKEGRLKEMADTLHSVYTQRTGELRKLRLVWSVVGLIAAALGIAAVTIWRQKTGNTTAPLPPALEVTTPAPAVPIPRQASPQLPPAPPATPRRTHPSPAAPAPGSPPAPIPLVEPLIASPETRPSPPPAAVSTTTENARQPWPFSLPARMATPEIRSTRDVSSDEQARVIAYAQAYLAAYASTGLHRHHAVALAGDTNQIAVYDAETNRLATGSVFELAYLPAEHGWIRVGSFRTFFIGRVE